MKIGVIGANGFIGRHLVGELIKNNHEIRVWDREKHGDFLKKDDRSNFLNNFQFDAIYQAAWIHIENSNYRNEIRNLDFAFASIDFATSCSMTGIKVILVGSTFADNSENLDQYSMSKRLLKDFIHEVESEFIFLAKPTYVFSIQDRRPHLFRQYLDWFESLNKSVEFPIQNPNLRLDFIHVQDVASGLCLFLRSEIQIKEITISSGMQFTVREALKSLSNALHAQSHNISHSNISIPIFKNNMSLIISQNETSLFFKQSDSICK